MRKLRDLKKTAEFFERRLVDEQRRINKAIKPRR
jgi:hypothetical protein